MTDEQIAKPIPERWKNDFDHSSACDKQACCEARFLCCVEELGEAESRVRELEQALRRIANLPFTRTEATAIGIAQAALQGTDKAAQK